MLNTFMVFGVVLALIMAFYCKLENDKKGVRVFGSLITIIILTNIIGMSVIAIFISSLIFYLFGEFLRRYDFSAIAVFFYILAVIQFLCGFILIYNAF